MRQLAEDYPETRNFINYDSPCNYTTVLLAKVPSVKVQPAGRGECKNNDRLLSGAYKDHFSNCGLSSMWVIREKEGNELEDMALPLTVYLIKHRITHGGVLLAVACCNTWRVTNTVSMKLRENSGEMMVVRSLCGKTTKGTIWRQRQLSAVKYNDYCCIIGPYYRIGGVICPKVEL